jgi:hypothetical protein
MSMCAIFVTLAKLSVCQKQWQVVPYHEYDVDEENDGHDPGGEYDCESNAMSLCAIFVTLAKHSVSEIAGSCAVQYV